MLNSLKTYKVDSLSAMRMPRLAVRLIVAASAASLMTSAWATETYPRALQGAVDNGVKVVRTFPAASGLTGWVLSEGGHYSLVFTTADKKSLLLGTLIGENGENLSAHYAEKYIPKPDLAALLPDLEKSAYVVEGTTKDPKSVIYVFVDANCPFCHFTWQALQPYEKAGLQVRWILVATLGPTSMPKAIEVMAASDKTAAFRKMENNHGKSWSPTQQSSETANPTIAANIRKNGELMEKFGIDGTPGVVWKDKQGKLNVKGGMPRLSEIPSITGLPEQKISDPALERFR
ncbi:thiol:disulfide interchange protein DsbG [Noviherbaspirillum sp.]|jgi:thiol:disulfide interchange protein DsbG|uniref:thiol:disulfide interchange protein DsbG n=1 Tax=Noviherbaspirillum sp. TaxID=1926288 RepID=UPI0025CD1FBD|nr:thiol:disulfide interchange protein DsbG [Noviherbaspirillum sp.]